MQERIGIINKAIDASKQTTYAIEKEKILMAIPISINTESDMKLNFQKLQDELNKQDEVEVTNRGKYFVVDFKNTGRKYRVNKDDYSIQENYDSSYFAGFGSFVDYKDNIKTVQFVKYINVPEGAIQEDLSKDKDGSIIGWIEENTEDSEKYDFYIGSDKTIISQADSCYRLFCDWTKTDYINFDNFDTWEVTNMKMMFYQCRSLVHINAEYLEVTNVTNMSLIFGNCYALQGVLDLREWNIENVTDFSSAFVNAGLNELILNGQNSNIKSIGGMFNQCKAEKIVISGLDTTNVTGMKTVFHGCSNLKYLDISSFCFDNVEDWANFIAYGSRNDAIVYVKDEKAQQAVLAHRSGWTEENVRIK